MENHFTLPIAVTLSQRTETRREWWFKMTGPLAALVLVVILVVYLENKKTVNSIPLEKKPFGRVTDVTLHCWRSSKNNFCDPYDTLEYGDFISFYVKDEKGVTSQLLSGSNLPTWERIMTYYYNNNMGEYLYETLRTTKRLSDLKVDYNLERVYGVVTRLHLNQVDGFELMELKDELSLFTALENTALKKTNHQPL
jgi:predicted restriction endonuclease